MKWRMRGGLVASGQRRRVPAARLSRSLREGRTRAAAHEAAYVDTLERLFYAEAGRVARRFEKFAQPHALSAAAPTAESTMVAVYPSLEQAQALAQPNGEPVEIIHCTLAFLGELDVDQAEQVAAVLARLAPQFEPLSGVVGGVAAFGSETGVQAEVARVAGLVAPEGGYGDTAWHAETSAVWWIPADWTSNEEAAAAEQAFLAIPQVQKVVVGEAESRLPIEGFWPGVAEEGWVPVFAQGRPLVEASYPSIALPDVPGLAELRHGVCEALYEAGIDHSRLHGWTPHMTLAYLGDATPPPADLLGMPLTFDRVYITRGDIPRSYPLGTLTAATTDPPDWQPPHSDEVFNPEEFAHKIRTKSDPVRQAVIEASIAEGLDLAGLDFDVTNPLVKGALVKTGAKVVDITDATRAAVMRTIGYGYDQGLSIPDTAKLIREGMREASRARAETIARTEMASLVNGGELAATKIVTDATGALYFKRWLTADGAKDPRHEEYDGLDGQTVALDEPFDVGGSPLMYPGDPDGPAEEVINCRCTTIMVDSLSGESDTGDGGEGEGGDEEGADVVEHPTAKELRDTFEEPTMWGEGDDLELAASGRPE